jgi:fatty-acid desaturase
MFSFSMDVVVFFSPSTKSRHRARGHQNHHQHDGKEVNVDPADINDAEFYDFVQSSQQMMMEEIGKQKRQQQQQQQLRSNRSEKQAAKSRQKAVASISQEEYEIRLLKARLAELEQASRG